MRLRSLRQATGRRVRVHTRDRSVEGVLVYASRQSVVLEAAEVPQPIGQAAIPILGSVIVDRAQVSFYEVKPEARS